MMIDINRLKILYRKGWLSDDELEEYSELRKGEYLERKEELTLQGKLNIKAVKGSDNDIIGFTWGDEEVIQEIV